MAKKGPKSPILEALRGACQDEAAAVEFLEKRRWGDDPACPRCGDLSVYQMTAKDGTRNKDYRWRCRGCDKMFTVRTGTVFEETRLPLRVWVYAFWKACSCKKGIAALHLAREMEITHKSALFVLRRIRHGLGLGNDRRKLKGTVEVDEMYHGPRRTRYKGMSKVGRGTSKIPILGIAERGGDVRFHVMNRLTAKDISAAMLADVDTSARIMSDEYQGYRWVGKVFKGGHFTTKHYKKEYVRPGTDIHSNSIEGVFSLVRRGVTGVWHSVSRKHLPNYLDAIQFRFSNRYCSDGERVERAIRAVDGKRLTYRESVDDPPYLSTTT